MPKKPIRILLMFTEEIMRCAETMKRLWWFYEIQKVYLWISIDSLHKQESKKERKVMFVKILLSANTKF